MVTFINQNLNIPLFFLFSFELDEEKQHSDYPIHIVQTGSNENITPVSETAGKHWLQNYFKSLGKKTKKKDEKLLISIDPSP